MPEQVGEVHFYVYICSYDKAMKETARNLLKLGVPMETVVQATGLSEEELSQQN